MATAFEPEQSEEVQLARALELRTAERDGALVLLAQLVRTIERHGGYLVTEDQWSLSAAKQMLDVHGVKRQPPRKVWKDRP